MRSIGTQDDDDPFDENGVLKDGRRWRVPLRMADSMQRAIGRRALCGSQITDGSGGTSGLHRPGFRMVSGTARDAIRDARAAAYQEYDAAISEEYKSPPAGTGSNGFVGPQEGDVCTYRSPEFPNDIGSPGHMRMHNGRLICVPYRSRAGGQDGADPRQAAYGAYEKDLTNAWRGCTE